MNRILKRLIPAFLALTMLITPALFTGCSKKAAPEKSKPTNVFKAEYIEIPEEIGAANIWSTYYGGGKFFIPSQSYTDNSETYVMWSFDSETGKAEKYFTCVNDYTENSGAYIQDCQVLSDGSLIVFMYEYSFDEETGDYTNTSPVRLYTSPDVYTEIDFDTPINAYDGTSSEEAYHYYYNIKALPNGDICVSDGNSNGSIYVIRDFKEVVTCIKSDENVYFNGINIAKDGRAILNYYNQTDYKDAMCYLDLESGKLGEKFESTGLGNYIYSLNTPPENSKYDFYFSTNNQIYGYTIATDSSEIVCDWVNSDVNSNELGSVAILSDDKIMGIVNSGSKKKIGVFNRVPDEEITEKYIINYAGDYINYNLINTILRFNRSNPDYRIAIKDYSLYNTNENYELGQTKLNNDIISGNIPDIIQLSSQMPVSSYMSKGLFADLNEFMDRDESFNREDYLTNVFDALSVGGKLYQISPYFSVTTMVAKKSLVGDVDHITPGQMIEIIKSNPDARIFEDMTRDSFLRYIIQTNMNRFVDNATGICRFDSDEFIELLELSMLMPEKSIYEEEYGGAVMYDVAYDDDFWNELYNGCRTGKTLFYSAYLGDYRTYWSMYKGTFGDEIALIGYPAEDSNGSAINADFCLAMSAKGTMQEGIWEFFKYVLSEELFTEDNVYLAYAFPVNIKALNRLAEDNMQKNYYENADGTREEFDTTWWTGNEEIVIGEIDKEHVEKVNDFLRSLRNVTQYDNELMDIISEEASAYFSGAKTSAEAASLIQNRASIFVNERR